MGLGESTPVTASPSTNSDGRLQTADWWLLAIVAASTAAWCLSAARELGATFDEPFYLEAGLDAWRRGSFRDLLAAGTMPLAPYLQTLPLYVAEVTTGRPWVISDDIGGMLPVARSVTLIFYWLLLLYCMRLGRALGGPWAGRLAMVLVAVDPNFLAHAALATTDICLAAFLMAFTVHYRNGRASGWARRVALPMVLLALAMLAKASALTFAPLVMLAVEVEQWAATRQFRRDGVLIFLGGILLAAVLCGPGGGPSFQGTLARMDPDHILRPALAWFGALPLSPNAFFALWYQADHNQTGQPTYLLGYESARSLWFYVPVIPVIKLPLATLYLAAASVLVQKRRWAITIGLCGVVLVLMAIIRVQTGIRLLLPLLAFGFVGIAVSLVTASQTWPERRRQAAAVLAALLVLTAIGDLRVWPDALRFTNALAGGPVNGYKNVSDSNYDWGQGLPELAKWQQLQSKPVAVWYFGTDPRFPQLRRYDPRRDGLNSPVLEGHLLAVSASLLYGGYVTAGGPGRDLMLRLRGRQPLARTRTFFIFDDIEP